MSDVDMRHLVLIADGECACPEGWPRKRPLVLVPEEWWDGRYVVIPSEPEYPVLTGSGWFVVRHTGDCPIRDEVVHG